MITLSWKLYKHDIEEDCVFSWSCSFCCGECWKIFHYSRCLFQSQALSGFTFWMGWKASCNKTSMALLPWSTEMGLCMSLEVCLFGAVSVDTYKEKLNISICSLKMKRCFPSSVGNSFQTPVYCAVKLFLFKTQQQLKKDKLSQDEKTCNKFWCTMLLHASCRERKLDSLGCDEAQQDFLKQNINCQMCFICVRWKKNINGI